jgi:endonuclease/exonuclease/phosphatase family metal-dependent hydrolase
VLLSVATYNIHRCVGTDRRHLPERTATVIRELNADVVGLQEVDAGYHIEHGLDQADFLAKATGLQAVAAPTCRREDSTYGNGLLTRYEIDRVDRFDLSVAGREPRGALIVDVLAEGRPVRVIVTHLGLRRYERVAQVDRIFQQIGSATDRPLVILGDFNEWYPTDPSLRRLHARFGRSRLRTFPSYRPLFSFDRILVEPRHLLLRIEAHSTPTARIASDHLPVRAILDLDRLPAEPPLKEVHRGRIGFWRAGRVRRTISRD